MFLRDCGSTSAVAAAADCGSGCCTLRDGLALAEDGLAVDNTADGIGYYTIHVRKRKIVMVGRLLLSSLKKHVLDSALICGWKAAFEQFKETRSGQCPHYIISEPKWNAVDSTELLQKALV